MKFCRVVGVVGERWASVAQTVNRLEGRVLFSPSLDQGDDGESNEIQGQISGDVLYLGLAMGDSRRGPAKDVARKSNSTLDGARGAKARTRARASAKGRGRSPARSGGKQKRGSGGDKGAEDRSDEFWAQLVDNCDALRRLTFLCLCSHTMLWVHEPGPAHGLSLETFRRLLALNSARQKTMSILGGRLKAGKKNWPGRCQPWLLFVFVGCTESSLKALQVAVNSTLKACCINCSSNAKACVRIKGQCCSMLGEDGSSAHLDKALSDLDVPSSQRQLFSFSDWISAASLLLPTLRMPDDSTGIISTVRQQQNQTNARGSPSGAALAVPKKGGARGGGARGGAAQQEKSINLENYFRMEEQYQRSICEKAFPRAVESYTRGLPPRYNTSVHNAHVDNAVAEFRAVAGHKGIVGRRWERKLNDICRRVWRGQVSDVDAVAATSGSVGSSSAAALSGKKKSHAALDRRLCDAQSLFGHACVELQRKCVKNNVVDLRKCRSGVNQRLACACGRSVVERADPFTTGAANNLVSRQGVCCTSGARFTSSGLPWALTTLPVAHAAQDETREDSRGASLLTGNSIVNLPNFVPGFNRMELALDVDGGQIFVGLEFENHVRSTRQFFPPASLQSTSYDDAATTTTRTSGNNGPQPKSMAWPDEDVDLFVSMDPAGGSDARKEMAQLQRIYVNNTSSTQILIDLKIQFAEPSGGGIFSFKDVIAAKSFACLLLPHIYPVLPQQQNQQAYLCPFFLGNQSAAKVRAGFVKPVVLLQKDHTGGRGASPQPA